MNADTSTTSEALAIEGKTVWASARAERAAIVVDAQRYFKSAKLAMLEAKHTIMLQGWDFDARVELEPKGKTLPGPNRIGDFLLWLGKERPELDISLLRWDMGAVRGLFRGETPLSLVGWSFRKNMHAKFDGAHHKLAAHHMKLLVIDDALAFCGGIDMTEGRWDTREHVENDPARHDAKGNILGPWHDATSCVSGEAAAKLGELAARRWRRATGHLPTKAPPRAAFWCDEIKAEYHDLKIGIARTAAVYHDYEQVSEIEKLTYAIIAAAKNTLYIESQYLASRHIVEAMARRLEEPDGPEIIVINPDTADGWLESEAMDSARSKLLAYLRKHDPHDRFRIYYPTNASGTPIYVHAKVMIADDVVLKIGSANLNNRSMGYDTECDLLIEAAGQPDPEKTSAQIRWQRLDMIAEHFAISIDEVEQTIADKGGMVPAFDAMQNRYGRLVPLESEELDNTEEVMAETDLVDPERPTKTSSQLSQIVNRFIKKTPLRA